MSTAHAATETMHGAAEAAHTAANSAKNIARQASEAMAPIKKGILKGQQIGENIKATTERSRTFLERILRSADPGDAQAKSVLFPPTAPFYAAADVVDATAGTAARRGLELTIGTGSVLRAFYRTLTRPFFHPLSTLFRPFKYLANPLRLITSSAEMVSRIVNAPFRTIDELINRGVKRPLQRFENIPLIGKPLAYLGKGLGWVANAPRKIFEFLTFSSPIRKIDDWVSSKQG